MYKAGIKVSKYLMEYYTDYNPSLFSLKQSPIHASAFLIQLLLGYKYPKMYK